MHIRTYVKCMLLHTYIQTVLSRAEQQRRYNKQTTLVRDTSAAHNCSKVHMATTTTTTTIVGAGKVTYSTVQTINATTKKNATF